MSITLARATHLIVIVSVYDTNAPPEYVELCNKSLQKYTQIVVQLRFN